MTAYCAWTSSGRNKATNGQTYLSDLLHLLDNLYSNFMEIIGLKALGNYSASFWSHTFSNLLCERPKPNTSMISGFSDL